MRGTSGLVRGIESASAGLGEFKAFAGLHADDREPLGV
jgi:hypothetical protein